MKSPFTNIDQILANLYRSADVNRIAIEEGEPIFDGFDYLGSLTTWRGVRFAIELSSTLDLATQYLVLAHFYAHIALRHLATPSSPSATLYFAKDGCSGPFLSDDLRDQLELETALLESKVLGRPLATSSSLREAHKMAAVARGNRDVTLRRGAKATYMRLVGGDLAQVKAAVAAATKRSKGNEWFQWRWEADGRLVPAEPDRKRRREVVGMDSATRRPALRTRK